MNSTTLRGIFPDPKPVHRRNFIKENIKQIKQMQGLLQDSGLINPRNSSNMRSDKYRNVPPKVSSNTGSPTTKKSSHQLQITRSLSQNSKVSKKQSSRQNSTFSNPIEAPLKMKPKVKQSKPQEISPTEQRFRNRAMQTEKADDLTSLYEHGVIRYPSPHLMTKRSPKKKTLDCGDRISKKSFEGGDQTSNELSEAIEQLDLNDKDYVRENITNIKKKITKQGGSKDPTKPPPTYQKGVLPKYLQERKEELRDKDTSYEPECPLGHVLLPDEERKETLRVLRQSYADRISELNAMPVRSDTLRMKKRKMEIEEELKKIDEGIKVFQRPKVFVKINA